MPSSPIQHHNNLSPVAPQLTSPDPSSTVSANCNNSNNINNNSNNTFINTCPPPHDLAFAGVQAAASISPSPAYESLIFSSIIHDIITLPVSTISHVPRKVRPLLAQVISTELRHVRVNGLWGFTCLSLLPKAILRPPPRGGKKKRYVVDALISSRLRGGKMVTFKPFGL